LIEIITMHLNIILCFWTLLLFSGLTFETPRDKRGWLQGHSYSPGLAKTILVPGSPTIIVCKTTSSVLERGHFVSIQGKKASSRPGETPSAHAWLLSGRLSDREASLKKQPSASLEQLDSQQG
jgi:hypothetical protein